MSRGPAPRIRVGLALACAGLAAGCGARTATVAVTRPSAVTASLSTSLTTAQGTWAIAVMGGSAASHNNFWQLFVRRANTGRWSLVTPEGVADNGGLVAAGGNGSLVVGFRPSQELAYSPLATSTDAGLNWTPGLLDAALADTPGAIAVGPSGRTLALLQDGTIEAAPTADDAAAGQWVPLATLKALAASAPGRSCGLKGMTAVSFGPDQNPIAAGSCVRPGAAGVFTDAGGTWRSAGLTLPGDGPGMGTVRVLGLTSVPGGNAALLAISHPGGNSLLAAWWDGTRWTVSAPVTAADVRALGFGPGGKRVAAAGRQPGRDHRRGGEHLAGAATRARRHQGARTTWDGDTRAGDRRILRRAGRGRVQAHRVAARRGSLGQGPADQRAGPVRLVRLGAP